MPATVAARDLRRAARAVRHAAGHDLARPILTTVLFSADAEHLYLVAADNFRIARCEVPLLSGDPEDIGSLTSFVSEDGVARLRASLPHGDTVVTIARDGGRLDFEWADGSLSVNIPTEWNAGLWPPYTHVAEVNTVTAPDVPISPAYLRDAARAAWSAGEAMMRITVAEWDRPVRIDAGLLTEWIMPIRSPANHDPVRPVKPIEEASA